MAPKKSTSTKKTESNDLFGILSEEDLNKQIKLIQDLIDKTKQE